jgi:hypothetical protein
VRSSSGSTHLGDEVQSLGQIATEALDVLGGDWKA